MPAMSKIDLLKKTRYLIEVLNQKSLGKAGDVVGISAPQMSREISLLEKELNVKLLNRSATGVSPTKEGALFAEKMSPLITRLIQIERQAILSTRQEAIVELPPSLGNELFPKWIAEFTSINPQAHVKIRVTAAKRFMQKHLGEFVVTLERNPSFQNLIAIEITRVPLVLVASPEYLSNAGDIIIPEELEFHKAWYSPSETEPPLIIHNSQSFYKINSKTLHSAPNFLALKNTILAGDGIGVGIPKFLVQKELAEKKIVEIIPGWKLEPEVIWFMRPPSRFPSLISQRLVSWFRQKASEDEAFKL